MLRYTTLWNTNIGVINQDAPWVAVPRLNTVLLQKDHKMTSSKTWRVTLTLTFYIDNYARVCMLWIGAVVSLWAGLTLVTHPSISAQCAVVLSVDWMRLLNNEYWYFPMCVVQRRVRHLALCRLHGYSVNSDAVTGNTGTAPCQLNDAGQWSRLNDNKFNQSWRTGKWK